MGETIHKLKQIGEDLKSSWYFRFWALSSLALGIIGFVCLIVLGAQSTHARLDPASTLWFENASSIYYPRFHYRSKEGMSITNVSCHHFLAPVETGLCEPYHGYLPSLSECVAVYAQTIEIINSPEHEFFDMGVSCNITTVGNSTEVGNLIAFEIEEENYYVVGPDPIPSLWIAPTDRAFVILEKGVTKVNKKTTINDWARTLQYQSTVSRNGFYDVKTVIQDFGIFHIDVQNTYNGWKAIGDIGGFAFSLVCFQSLFMIAIGLCFYNNSVFLRHSEQTPSGGNHLNIPTSEYQVINK